MSHLRDLHEFVDLSHFRNIYVCGDVHGTFELVEAALVEVNFNETLDRLIFVGDLIDKGTNSKATLEWITKPWVLRVLGNHEMTPRWFLEGVISRSKAYDWGCEWFIDLPREEIYKLAELLEAAPVAMTVLTPQGKRIGFAHADCCRDWDRQIECLSPTSINRIWVTDMSLQSRETIKPILKALQIGASIDPEDVKVANVDHVFHGHAPTPYPITLANRSWIDTGAFHTGVLTLVNIDHPRG